LWRRIMKHTLKDRHVMAATEFPDMLEVFTKAIEDLETCAHAGGAQGAGGYGRFALHHH